jgi:hypothetical protein
MDILVTMALQLLLAAQDPKLPLELRQEAVVVAQQCLAYSIQPPVSSGLAPIEPLMPSYQSYPNGTQTGGYSTEDGPYKNYKSKGINI